MGGKEFSNGLRFGLLTLGLASFCVHAADTQTKSTGRVVRYDRRPVLNLTNHSLLSPSRSSATIGTEEHTENQSSQALALIKPESLMAPTFAGDLADAMASEEVIRDIERDYGQRLRDFAQRTGYFETARDSRSFRPIGWTKGYESDIRTQMANSLKGYMIARGIPRFLKSREETKKIAKTYEGVANAAKVEFKTKDNWMFSTRLDPGDMHVKLRYHNSLWNFEGVTRIEMTDPYLLAQRRYGLYTPEVIYYVIPGVVAPGIGCQWTPLFSTKLATAVPMKSTQVLRDTRTSLVVDLRF